MATELSLAQIMCNQKELKIKILKTILCQSTFNH